MSEVFLFGSPVAHSLSPAMHNAAFKALGMPHRYSALDVEPDRLVNVVTTLRHGDALGANVTIPHKEAAVRLMDELSEEVRAIGALNTIVRRGPRLAGANTDVAGFESALRVDGRDLLAGAVVLMLGAGGAARACTYALLRRGSEVLVANRSSDRAETLVRTVALAGRRPRAVPWPMARTPLGVDGVVNTTPLGLHGEDPLKGIPLPHVVVDIVPTAEETPLVKRARAAENVAVVDGLSMLLHQAAGSFELWTGVTAPLEVMRSALPRPVAR
jgi:shikimate dehydrogenase